MAFNIKIANNIEEGVVDMLIFWARQLKKWE